MFNEKFGAKLDYGFGSMSEANGNRVNSLQPFDTNYWRLNLQGVANMGRVLNFESFSRSFGLLLHGGAGMGAVKPQSNRFAGTNDIVYNLIFGLTPQLKLSKNIALVGDISTILNGRQTVSWDGSTEILPDLENGYYGTNGTWWTGTIGLNFYLGKSEEHADWYIAADKYATKEELLLKSTESKIC